MTNNLQKQFISSIGNHLDSVNLAEEQLSFQAAIHAGIRALLDSAFAKLPVIHAMSADELVHYVRSDLALAHAEINGAYALIEIMVLMDFSGSISEVSELMVHLTGAKDRLLLLKGTADQRMAHLEAEAAKSSRPAILPAHLKLLH